jgi:probable HAF family extracellular repeat protein
MHTPFLAIRRFVVPFCFFLTASPFLVAQSFKAVPLNPLAGAKKYSTQVFGLNNAGTSVGICLSTAHACIWSADGTPQDLGSMGGSLSQGLAINNNGQIAGYIQTSSKDVRAFFWSPESGAQIIPSLGSGTSDEAVALNDSGQVVGYSYIGPPTSAYHAFLWSQSSGIQDLGSLPNGTSTIPYDINAAGDVVGQVGFAGGTIVGFLWTPTGGMEQIPGGPGFISYSALAMNDSNQVIGQYSDSSSDFNAYLWSASSGIEDLGSTPNGAVTSINDAGNVVGGVSGNPALWINGDASQNLSALVQPKNPNYLNGFIANGINANGEIVVNSGKTTGNTSFLLVPTTKTTLASLPRRSNVGQPVTFTATVASIYGPPPSAEIVSFTQGTTILGTAPLVNGVATFTTSSLAKGTDTIVASYPGDAHLEPSSSHPLKQIVN